MRLFIAISFSPALRDWLGKAQDFLRAHAEKGNFTRPENLHLTLHFLGETPAAQAGAIRDVMDHVTTTPFVLTLGGMGAFRRGGGDIWWLGIEKSKPLFDLHTQLGDGLGSAGFTIEQRPYKPHLTLGREILLNGAPDKKQWEEQLGHRQEEVYSIVLMKSERIQGLLRYTPLYKKAL